MLWKHQIYTAVNQLCTFDFPRNVYGPEADDAGFRAAMHGLYIESHFTEFLACQAWRQAGITEDTAEALNTLQHCLNAYDEPETDAAILADPAWWAILGQASRVVKLLS